MPDEQNTNPEPAEESTDLPAGKQPATQGQDDGQTTDDKDSAKIAELEEKWKRALADLANYKRQVEQERIGFASFANEKLLSKILPVLDNFKRATGQIPAEIKDNNWTTGITAIETQLEQTLSEAGLRKIKANVGDSCDPACHETIATGPGKTGTILELLEDGWEIQGKVLRPAKVKVGSGATNS